MLSLKLQNTLAKFLIILLLLLVLFAAGISEFFQNPLSLKPQSKQKNPLSSLFLSELVAINIDNKLGKIKLEKSKNDDKSGPVWVMVENDTNKIIIKEIMVDSLINSLKKIKIRKVLMKDPLQLSSLSLIDPLLKINLVNRKKEKIEIKFGLMNSIDKTTYIVLNNRDSIYQINQLDIPLDNLSKAQFVDQR